MRVRASFPVLIFAAVSAAFMFHTSVARAATPVTLLEMDGEGPNELFGHYQGFSMGDVNGDAVTTDRGGVGQRRRRRRRGACVGVVRRASSADDVADLVMTGGGANHRLGIALAFVGDVNDDGFGDFIVGAPNAGAGGGEAYVYYGGPGVDDVPI